MAQEGNVVEFTKNEPIARKDNNEAEAEVEVVREPIEGNCYKLMNASRANVKENLNKKSVELKYFAKKSGIESAEYLGKCIDIRQPYYDFVSDSGRRKITPQSNFTNCFFAVDCETKLPLNATGGMRKSKMHKRSKSTRRTRRKLKTRKHRK